MKFLHLVLCSWICSNVLQFIVYRNLNRICILLLCEKCINLNYVELVHTAFQVYYIFLLLCIFILLIFESLILKLQLKILIYLIKNDSNIQWNYMQFCSVFYKSPVHVVSYLHRLKNKKEKKMHQISKIQFKKRECTIAISCSYVDCMLK